MKPVLRISIVGAGRMAQALGLALKNGGVEIVEVWNRTSKESTELATMLSSQSVDNLEDLSNDVDAVAILVKDDAIVEVAAKIPSGLPRFHASGVTSIDVLGGECGVIWPIKSINKESVNDGFKDVPLGIEANSESMHRILNKIIKSVEGVAFKAGFETRSKVHLAAVFADNFSNHCLAISQTILKESGLPTELLLKLVEGLTVGASNGSSFSRQTGVALRGDLGSQRKHLELLSEYSNDGFPEFYSFISQHISEFHDNKSE